MFNGIPPSQNIGIIRYIIYVNSVLGLGVVGRGGGGGGVDTPLPKMCEPKH